VAHAGWYQDPEGTGRLRCHDGNARTEHRADADPTAQIVASPTVELPVAVGGAPSVGGRGSGESAPILVHVGEIGVSADSVYPPHRRLIKERTVQGPVQVSVQGEGYDHASQVPAASYAAVTDVQRRVDYVRQLAVQA
jgi:hypothetical protein